MKNLVLTVMVAVFMLPASSQTLLDIYKKGTVRLVPDTEYAKGNDWNRVFRSYHDSLYGKAVGHRKSLVMMPDGSVVVNHDYTNYYTKFSPAGQFVKEFGITDSKGGRLKKIQRIEGMLNNHTFYTKLDNIGFMNLLDLNGKLIKKLKFKDMTSQIIPLDNTRMAMVSRTYLPESKTKDYVAIIDYTTYKQKILWEKITYMNGIPGKIKRSSYSYTFKSGGSISMSVPTENTLPILSLVGNRLIISFPETGEILEYDLNGHLLSKGKINWERNFISVEEQKKKLLENINRIINPADRKTAGSKTNEEMILAQKAIAKQMEEDLPLITEPKPIPTFATIIRDSDGNLLFFEFPEKKNENKFNVWVYRNGGQFVCQSHFVCSDYNLEINPSRMVFRNGYLYSLQESRNASGIPLRLVRFRLTAD